ncbi:MAG: ATP-binding cassette domain-containing protein [Actinomycetaceae bacterium]|nr:ATP-binding cassette domain-containing protein [Arcanobacterium sp.]MDD7687520.1 ATP-binding cassette domain-containing protein [Actinomycetaceae bacterium]MDY5272994.1 ATP-binding cassette domain-containing protein [Arcanobacterium sp.]
MPTISLDNVSFSYSSIPLLDRVSLYVGDGERACLVGPNGCGKTTLLRIASGDLLPERGTVTVGEATSRLFPVLSIEKFSGTVEDYLAAALHPLHAIADRFYDAAVRIGDGATSATLAATNRDYDRLLAQMTNFDIWALDARVAEVLAGLGLEAFAGSRSSADVSTLSPGQRGSLQLAVTLIAKPQVLILDEPTNYLDVDAMHALEETLARWRGTLVVASHDRWLINHWQGRRIHVQR